MLAIDGAGVHLSDVAPDHLRVVAVEDPGDFLEMLVADRPRIAVVSEPPANAAVLGALVRECRRRQNLRIIHLSRPIDVEARLAALRSGFDEALPASIDPGELAGHALILDERTRAKATAPLPIAAGYELDLVAHELWCNGRPVHLRPKEFQLLALLAANPGRAYTRRQLLDRVWGPDQIGDPRTVDVHIRWLRSKIEPRPGDPIHLVTVRGVGYRLDPPLTEP